MGGRERREPAEADPARDGAGQEPGDPAELRQQGQDGDEREMSGDPHGACDAHAAPPSVKRPRSPHLRCDR